MELFFSHAYSIPVSSIKVTDKITGGDFNYIDYCHSSDYTEFKRGHLKNKDTDFLD